MVGQWEEGRSRREVRRRKMGGRKMECRKKGGRIFEEHISEGDKVEEMDIEGRLKNFIFWFLIG